MNIAIYGVGIEGEKFYCRWKNEYSIKFAIDRDNGRRFHNLEVFSIEDVTANKMLEMVDCIVVAAAEKNYKEIRRKLHTIGLKENIDFYSVSNFVNKGRKVAILYGNCHFEVLKQYLESNKFFRQEYLIEYYYISKDMEADTLQDIEMNLSRCSLFISHDVKENNALGVYSYEYLASKCNPDCICIKVPNLYGMNLYFPQVKGMGEFDRIFKKHIGEQSIGQDNIHTRTVVQTIIGFRDVYVECMITEGKTAEEIASFIKDESVWNPEEIQFKCQEAIKKLELREKSCDVVISDYIKENYKRKKLFYDPNHPASDVVIEKGRRILNRLNIPIEESVAVTKFHDMREIFVYGCVKKALDLCFEDDFIKSHNFGYTLANEPINLIEYIEEYMCWM